MKVLFIDTHLYDIKIILFEDDKILSQKNIVGEKHNSKYLLPTINEVCGDNNFDQIIVVNGPGSFTGVRLGVTVAKTLAYSKKIPIRTITSLDLLNFSGDNNHHYYSISDGNGYFIGEYEEFKQINELFYLSNQDYQQFINSNNVITSVIIDYSRILKKALEKSPINPHGVNPIYVKLIGVENDKKNR